MRWRWALCLLGVAIAIGSSGVRAQSVEVDNTDQQTGKVKASQYLRARQGQGQGPSQRQGQGLGQQEGQQVEDQTQAPGQGRRPASARSPASSGSPTASPRYLALQVGTFFSDQSYKWGKYDQNNVGELNAGVTYRLGEWVNSMDFSARVEFTTYDLDGDTAQKLSIGPLITFPDANSRFPLYFGGGVGAGLFIKQVNDRSPLGLDWQVIAGARFFDVIQHVGLVLETGLKNHIMLGSVGQYNGVFITAGTVFAF